jgi:hypothetical protein
MNTLIVCIAIGGVVGLACIVGYLADGPLMTQPDIYPKDRP